VLLFALVFPSVMTWAYFVALPEIESRPGPAFQVVYGIAKAVQLGLPLVFFWRTAPDQLRPSAPTTRGLGLGLLFGVVVAAGIGGLYAVWLRGHPLIAEAPAKIHAILVRMHVETPGHFLMLAAALAIGHSLLEEYYWRWFVYFGLRRLLPFWPALLVGCAGFMAHHVILLAVYFPGPTAFVVLVVPFSLAVAVGGAFWSWLYERSGSFYAPWLSHLIVDAALMAVGYDLVAGYWVN
jgi:membrane protease YdiL (CAAX protease family)